ncbi:SPFH domain-containing protein [bacterium]|nr:SPFH domain-containing protein [bacterium]
MKENIRTPHSGKLGCLLSFGVLGLCVAGVALVPEVPARVIFVAAGVLTLFLSSGTFTLDPNEAAVLQFFGAYAGTVKTDALGGLWWVNPLYKLTKVSLRVQNFESTQLKVNDHEGNPIEIAAIVSYKLEDTAQATFAISNSNAFVKFQTEAALRNLATRYPYDAHQEGQRSLRGDTSTIAQELRKEIQDHLGGTGIEVVDARISHLAYAPEIAAAMLQRQQASAMIAARQKIVEGAVGMVETALQLLAKNKIVELDDKQKAQMVGNLLVVLCSHAPPQPVLNAGTSKP